LNGAVRPRRSPVSSDSNFWIGVNTTSPDAKESFGAQVGAVWPHGWLAQQVAAAGKGAEEVAVLSLP